MHKLREIFGKKFFFSVPKHLLQGGVALLQPPFHVHEGNTDCRPFEDGPKSFLIFTEGLHRLKTIRNINHDALDNAWLSRLIAYYNPFILNPYDMAIPGYQTIFQAKWFLILVTIVDRGEHTLSVIGVESLHPEVGFTQPIG
jgi:hypothetical protein